MGCCSLLGSISISPPSRRTASEQQSTSASHQDSAVDNGRPVHLYSDSNWCVYILHNIAMCRRRKYTKGK